VIIFIYYIYLLFLN